MGHHHGHGASRSRPGARHRWRLAAAFGLTAAFFVVELSYGLLSGSLALLSDAGHMAADVVTLAAALVATRVADRNAAGRRTYGSYRAEIFASLFAVLTMLGVAAYIVVEAARRAGEAASVEASPMVAVGALGLVINVVALLLLRSGAATSLNVKGAYFEVMADAAGSAGVIVAGVLVAATGRSIWDTLVALAIGAFVVARAVALGRQVFAVLAQHAPREMDVDVVAADLAAIEGVRDVHDLHLWTLTSGLHVATAHLVTRDEAATRAVLDQAGRVLRERHDISHATLQVEPGRRAECDELSW